MIDYPPVVRSRLGEHHRLAHTVTLDPGPDEFVVDATDLVVDLDAGRLVRRNMSLSAPFTTGLWERVREWATPVVRVDVAYVAPTGIEQRRTVFTGRVAAVDSSRPADTLRITAHDPTAKLLDYPLEVDLDLTGQSTHAAIAQLLADVGLVLASTGGVPDRTLEASVHRAGTSRGDVVDALVDGVLADVVASPTGDVELVAQPTTVDGASASFLAVGAYGTVITSSSGYDRDAFANRYRITARYRDAAGTETSATGSATDTDPNSPTRYGGPAGRRERHDTVDYAADGPQLAEVARARLFRLIGAGRGLTITTPPALWLEPWDIVTVQLPYGDAWQHILQRVSHDLGRSLTTVDTRRPLSTIIE